MRTPAPPALVVVLVAALAGCAAPDPAPAPPEGAPWSATWGLAGCTAVLVVLPVDAARLRDRLPEGFGPRTSALLPGGLGPGEASIHVDAYECTGEGGTFPMYGSYYAPVEPPAGRRAPEGAASAGHFVKWDTLLPDQAARAPFAAEGLPVFPGEARVTIEEPSGLVDARLRLEGSGGFTLRGLRGGPADPEVPFTYVEFTPLAGGGLASWWVQARAGGSTGVGQVELEPGTWVAEVLGRTSTQARFFAATWSIDTANVTAPT